MIQKGPCTVRAETITELILDFVLEFGPDLRAAQNRESHNSQNRGPGIARDSAARKKESNRNEVESRKIDSESPSELHPVNA